jgi:hypothetical protein
MLVETRKIKVEYTRVSKNKKSHTYSRYKTVVVLKCDACNTLFERDKGSMDRKRISNEYQHVCTGCNSKQFAQKVGVGNRNFWNIPAGSDAKI